MEQEHKASTPQPISETLAPALARITAPKPKLDNKPAKERDTERQSWFQKKLQMDMSHPQLKAALPDLTNFMFAVLHRQRGGVLVIYGPNGCGKTHIANKVRQTFHDHRMTVGPVAIENPQSGEQEVNVADCRFVNWPRAVKEVHSDQWLVFDYAAAEYLTIIDDIGAEHDPSSNGLAQLYLILNRREHKHTLITTNFPPEKWTEKFEKRVASRLYREATHVDLSKVPDYNA